MSSLFIADWGESIGGYRLYHHRKQIWEMDSTDDFHDYRIELHGSDVKVFVDGELRIDAATCDDRQ